MFKSRIMTNTKVNAYSTKYSQAVTHPSTNLAQCQYYVYILLYTNHCAYIDFGGLYIEL